MAARDEADGGRRTLLAVAGAVAGAAAGGAGLALGGSIAAAASPAAPRGRPPAPVDEGSVQADAVRFAPIHAQTERPDAPPPNPDPPDRRVGIAVMALGRLSLQNILPAFAECKHARLAGLVSGDAGKLRAVAAQYGVPASACHDYAGFDRIRDDPSIQAVYVVLPNGLHRDAVVRAARAGKHVLCEKPMANTAAEAREMVAACAAAGRKLMIAYRCRYEVHNVELRRRVQAGEFGAIRLVDAINTQNQGDPGQWRQDARLAGGGSLPDVGLYCLNTVRALLDEEPNEVWATVSSPAGDPRFREVESTVSFVLRFASGAVANCASSYAAHEHRNLRVLGERGTGEIENAFGYEGQRLRLSRRDGEAEARVELDLGRKNQFALEMDHFAQCVRDDKTPRTPGEEGVRDQVLMAAIYESARTGRPVRV